MAIRKYVQRGCTNRGMRDVLLAALDLGARMKRTRSGVTIYGPNGTAGTHMTVSDRRAAVNLAADLRRIGIPVDERPHRASQPDPEAALAAQAHLRAAWGSPKKWIGNGRFGLMLLASPGAVVTPCSYDLAGNAWVIVDRLGRLRAYGSSARGAHAGDPYEVMRREHGTWRDARGRTPDEVVAEA